MKQKVFGVGLNKTGTTSLGRALRVLGYKHQGFSLALLKEYLEEGFTENIRSVVDAHEAFEDFPWPLMWKELHQHYPDAKFILTKRSSAEVWFRSQCRHYEKYPNASQVNEPVFGSTDPSKDESSFLSYYDKFNDELISFFGEKIPKKLLVVSWENGDGWQEVCDFLQVPVPKIIFPHANSSTDPKEFQHFWSGKTRLAIVTLVKSLMDNPIKGRTYYQNLFWILKNVLFKKKI